MSTFAALLFLLSTFVGFGNSLLNLAKHSTKRVTPSR